MTPTEKVLLNVEELTTEHYGRGAAVSVDEDGKRCFVRCWNAKGDKVNEVESFSRYNALLAMRADLRLSRATRRMNED